MAMVVTFQLIFYTIILGRAYTVSVTKIQFFRSLILFQGVLLENNPQVLSDRKSGKKPFALILREASNEILNVPHKTRGIIMKRFRSTGFSCQTIFLLQFDR